MKFDLKILPLSLKILLPNKLVIISNLMVVYKFQILYLKYWLMVSFKITSNKFKHFTSMFERNLENSSTI